MSVLVATPLWYMFVRRKTQTSIEVQHLRNLLGRGQAQIIGPIRQEVLSGIRASEQFSRIRDALHAFSDVPLAETHFERAAEFYNTCRSKGIQGSNTDFLICAVANLEGLQIFTNDKDFRHFAQHLPIELTS